MNDCTPAPYGTVTRLWTGLSDQRRELESRRLIGVGLTAARIERPDEHTAGQYQQLVDAAKNGDVVALAWLATSHRPLLLARGRALFEDDPGEWGAVALELLHHALDRVNPCGRWMRRAVSLRLSSRMTRATQAHLERRRVELPLGAEHAAVMVCVDPDPHPDLSADLAVLLGRLDAATREALVALSDREPIAEIATRHQLSHAALRQRVVRARRNLQPALAGYRPGA